MALWGPVGRRSNKETRPTNVGYAALFDTAFVRFISIIVLPLGRITADTAPVRASRGRTVHKPTPVGYACFDALKTRSSVSLVAAPGTVKRPHPGESQSLIVGYNVRARALTWMRRTFTALATVTWSLLFVLWVRDTDLPHVLIVGRLHHAR